MENKYYNIFVSALALIDGEHIWVISINEILLL